MLGSRVFDFSLLLEEPTQRAGVLGEGGAYLGGERGGCVLHTFAVEDGFVRTQLVAPVERLLCWRSTPARVGLFCLLLTRLVPIEHNKCNTLSRHYKYWVDVFYCICLFYICSMANEKQPASRGPQLNIKLSAAEKQLTEEVAKKHGLNTSGLVRMLVMAEARRLGVEVLPQ